MIKIDAQGRLAHEPELRLFGKTKVVEFRLLSSRWAGGTEHTEAVTFFCFGEDAERFCENAEKGQEISATGIQETSSYVDQSNNKQTKVKYKLTWWKGGRKPFRGNQGHGNDGEHRDQSPRGHEDGASQGRPAQSGYPNRERQGGTQSWQNGGQNHGHHDASPAPQGDGFL